ncbi:MAG: ferritin-like domain-containing protein [Candidatus Eisenbacteria bacterium]
MSELETASPDSVGITGEPMSRRRVVGQLAKLGAGLALMAVPAAFIATPRRAYAGAYSRQDIIAVLNFALTLEYLEDEFYKMGLAAATLIPAADRTIFLQIGKHETAHVNLLKSLLGSSAVAKPTFDFTASGTFADVFTNYNTFLALSQGFEDTGVRAYKGQAPDLMSDDAALTTALRIHSVEARHACEVRRLRGQKGWITFSNTDVSALAAVYAGENNQIQGGVDVGASAAASEAFDEPLTMSAVLAIADPFIV